MGCGGSTDTVVPTSAGGGSGGGLGIKPKPKGSKSGEATAGGDGSANGNGAPISAADAAAARLRIATERDRAGSISTKPKSPISPALGGGAIPVITIIPPTPQNIVEQKQVANAAATRAAAIAAAAANGTASPPVGSPTPPITILETIPGGAPGGGQGNGNGVESFHLPGATTNNHGLTAHESTTARFSNSVEPANNPALYNRASVTSIVGTPSFGAMSGGNSGSVPGLAPSTAPAPAGRAFFVIVNGVMQVSTTPPPPVVDSPLQTSQPQTVQPPPQQLQQQQPQQQHSPPHQPAAGMQINTSHQHSPQYAPQLQQQAAAIAAAISGSPRSLPPVVPIGRGSLPQRKAESRDKIAVVDMLPALDNGDQNPQFLLELLEVHVAEWPNYRANLERGVRAHDWYTTYSALHQMKGVGLNLHLDAIVDAVFHGWPYLLLQQFDKEGSTTPEALAALVPGTPLHNAHLECIERVSNGDRWLGMIEALAHEHDRLQRWIKDPASLVELTRIAKPRAPLPGTVESGRDQFIYQQQPQPQPQPQQVQQWAGAAAPAVGYNTAPRAS